jgi:hypothetical protein
LSNKTEVYGKIVLSRLIANGTMRYAIQIPKPCHESWQDMTPDDNDRYCAQCCKTVVDFSGWEQDDIIGYLREHEEGKVCGRFRADQVDTIISELDFVQSVSYAPLPLYKKIAAIFLFAFGLLHMGNSAGAQTVQSTNPPQITSQSTNQPLIMGGAVPTSLVILDTGKHMPVHPRVTPVQDHHPKGVVAIKKAHVPILKDTIDQDRYRVGEVRAKIGDDTISNKEDSLSNKK